MLLKLQKKNIKTLSQDTNLLPSAATKKVAGGISADHICCTDETRQANAHLIQRGGNSRASDCCTLETEH
ncbi:hypothetical protein J8L98_13970 [Pseudoalteromonas sp. MMG013]|uniref:Orphan protein n=1 Tax=Pseudoalteromonas aurantia 208 TaxID=1314867 RepID=A0ABR9ECB9_9GAMM|nr:MULTISPECIES: hypothetical protein [Pseudoalteromonas]MBE0368618.1 hypothetical protein [Pseudoalteromonas aurantia 208]MBQ4846961.1 hypothetical protein [Pseudoalteromonas sp. MMG005]MBQ4852494.1 hypothetical protein [Pseudoalteromonas sp. MMG012]MBQ4862789.1 hypothetical protein [Pseudoalteromonas sp. MMG013]